eukprot:GHVH01017471.1.p1 GENE.GHVH01017471.1~~GHVH01017471.1.p1  ORF type:complete len:1204 (+),score=176.59 GHVH01017471.1:82-3612(+)
MTGSRRNNHPRGGSQPQPQPPPPPDRLVETQPQDSSDAQVGTRRDCINRGYSQQLLQQPKEPRQFGTRSANQPVKQQQPAPTDSKGTDMETASAVRSPRKPRPKRGMISKEKPQTASLPAASDREIRNNDSNVTQSSKFQPKGGHDSRPMPSPVKPRKALFEEYISGEALAAGLKSGLVWTSEVRMIGNADKAFVRPPKSLSGLDEDCNAVTFGDSDVIIASKAALNRCFHGDIVYLTALPESQWGSRVLDSDKAQLAVEVAEDCSTASSSRSQAKAKVVGIHSRSKRGEYAVFLEPNRNPSQRDGCTENNKLLDNDKVIRAISQNPKDPWFIVFMHDSLRIKYNLGVGTILNRNDIYRVTYDKWEIYNRMPTARITSYIGNLSDLSTKVGMIGCMYELEAQLCAVGEESEAHAAEIVRLEAEHRDDYLKGRADYRKAENRRAKRITYTIDPETSRDLDDAITYLRLTSAEVQQHNSTATGEYDSFRDYMPVPENKSRLPPKSVAEITVHVADVTHFMHWQCPTDQEAQKRTTTVYFPHECFPMLPRVLCDELCSLHPLENKLTLSVTFYVDIDSGDLLLEGDGYPWHIHRAIMESDARLSYEEAQIIIDGLRGGSLLHVATQHNTFPADLIDGSVLTTDKLIAQGVFKSNGWSDDHLFEILVALSLVRQDRSVKSSMDIDELHTTLYRLIELGAGYDDICDKTKQPIIADYMVKAKSMIANNEYVSQGDDRWRTFFEFGVEFRSDFFKSLLELDMLAQRVRRNRIDHGAGRFEQEKLTFYIDKQTGIPYQPKKESDSSSHELIAELMLLTNRIVATVLVMDESTHSLGLLRTHGNITKDKVVDLQNVLNKLVHLHAVQKGVDNPEPLIVTGTAHNIELVFDKAEKMVFDVTQDRQTSNFSRMAITGIFITCLQMATYKDIKGLDEISSALHWALGFSVYTHFTSPIRRYVDDMVHRAISVHLCRQGSEYWSRCPAKLIGDYDASTNGPHQWCLSGLTDLVSQPADELVIDKLAEGSAKLSMIINVVREAERNATRMFDIMLLNGIIYKDLVSNVPKFKRTMATCVFAMDRSIKVYIDEYGAVLNVPFNHHADLSELKVDDKIKEVIRDQLPFYREKRSESAMFNFDRTSFTLSINLDTDVVQISSLTTKIPVIVLPLNDRTQGITLLIDTNSIKR